MFRNVPECSGMFHVPGFIDAPAGRAGSPKTQNTKTGNQFHLHSNRGLPGNDIR